MNTDKFFKVNEIFFSIQGESMFTGKPTIFIRFTGCPFNCSYCDTAYAFTEGTKMSIDEILNSIINYKTRYLCITGGEPLVQPHLHDLINILLDENYIITIETSGLVDISRLNKNISITMDIKTPSSNESKNNIFNNINHLKKNDAIKFVIASDEDYIWSKKIIEKYSLIKICSIYFSPSFNEYSIKTLAENIINDQLEVTLQNQFHKQIWGDIRGK
ncbi:MAG: radical SAM protein [Pseudomonadota bacterium]|nr:radical SAM protein [Pseudomonadota bacterium]